MSKDKQIRELYHELPDLIKEACKQMNTTPEALGIDLDPHTYDKQTTWDRSDERDKATMLRFVTSCQCSSCKNEVKGELILDRRGLNVIDSKGFMIIDDVLCDSCLRKDYQKFVQRAGK